MSFLNKNQINHLENECTFDLKENIANYINHLKAENLSTNSIASYISDLLKALKIYKKGSKTNLNDFLNISLNEIRKILAMFSSERSQSRFTSSLKKFFEYNQVTSFVNKLKKPKIPKQLPKIIKEEELKNLINFKASKKEWINLRNQALIIILYTCGLRISEALNLKWEDISESFCKVRKGKREKSRFCPILKEAKEKLKEYKQSLENEGIINDYIFLNQKNGKMQRSEAYKIINNTSKKLQINSISPHTLRHSCASHLLKNGCNLKSISNLLGHERLDTTKIYISHSINEIQEIHKKIFNKKD